MDALCERHRQRFTVSAGAKQTAGIVLRQHAPPSPPPELSRRNGASSQNAASASVFRNASTESKLDRASGACALGAEAQVALVSTFSKKLGKINE